MFCETRFEFIRLKKNNKFETRLTKHDFLNHATIIYICIKYSDI